MIALVGCVVGVLVFLALCTLDVDRDAPVVGQREVRRG